MDDLHLRPAAAGDGDFCYSVQKATMQEYVEQTWGAWDEAFQQARFWARFDPAAHQIVVLDGVEIGVLLVEQRANEVFLGKIYILPAYQGRGIGTRLICALLDEAFAQGLPVILRVLKVNPARRLYARLGFTVSEETDEYFYMRAAPG